MRVSCASAFGAGLFSATVNVLALTGALYMLQLYDRVIPSHSVQTLVGSRFYCCCSMPASACSTCCGRAS